MALRMKMILTKEELKRCKFKDGELIIDLHELTVNQASRFVKNILLLCKEPLHIIFIHGYNHGTKLRDMLRTNDLLKTKYEIYADTINDGITHFLVA